MTLSNRSHKALYAAAGFILGLGSPLGFLTMRWWLIGRPADTLVWASSEISFNFMYYAYALVGTVGAFAVAGFWAGWSWDRVESSRKRLEDESLHDELTDLYNRRYVLERLREEIARAKRSGRPLSCLMIDVDYFKRLNDRYGHQVGDGALREVAHRLRAGAREGDVVGRFGGDEFVAILPDTAVHIAAIVAERMRGLVCALPCRAGEQKHDICVSIGAAEMSSQTAQADKLLAAADVALYAAKNEGRNRIVLASVKPRIAQREESRT